MSPLLNRANVSSTYGSKVAALRRQANAPSSGGGGNPIPDGDAVFISGGSQTWTCPADVTAARVVVIGAGGGAGRGCGGGGGGSSMRFYDNLVPGTAYVLEVGNPGSYNEDSGTQGGSSRFEGPGQTITAYGGYGGNNQSTPPNATWTAAGGGASGGQIDGTGGKGYPSANDPMGSWGLPQVPIDICGINGGAGGGGFGADNARAGHGGSGSMYAGGGGGGGSDNECGGDGGPGGELAIGGYTQRAMGGGGGGTDGTHLSSDTRNGSGGGTLGGYGAVYGGNAGEQKDGAWGGNGGNYGGSNGGEGGHGAGQQGGGGGGGSFGGGGGAGRFTSAYGGQGGGGLVYIKWGKDFDGTDVGPHYPIASTFNGRFDLIYHTCNITDNTTSQVRAPYGIHSGDLLIIMEYGPDVTSSITGNVPSGFTICSQNSEHAAVDQRLFYKVADGTEGGNNYYGQVGSNEDTHFFVFRGNVPLNSVSEQSAGSSHGQTGSNCSLSKTITHPPSQWSPYVFSVWTAGNRSSNTMYISGTNPATTITGGDGSGGNGWYHKPSLKGKHSNESECFSWRIDDTSGGAVNRDVSWNYGSTSRNTSLMMALNLDFNIPAGQAVLNSAGNATTWTCPADVHKVCVVCIGAGGGWTDSTGDTTITFGSVTLTAGGGKSRHTNSSAGGVASGGDSGGNWTGGAGYSSSYTSGGGGAAGYSGDGQRGCGGTEFFANTYTHGSGSGAGGQSLNAQTGDGLGNFTGGGGVGMYGKGADATGWSKGGSGGQDAPSWNGGEYYGGGGGNTGNYGTRTGGGGALCWKNNIAVVPGTTYNAYIGGGGNGGSEVGAGGHGQIRIIWGHNRAFPSLNTGDV